MEEVRPMTDEEAKEWIKKYYGSHERRAAKARARVDAPSRLAWRRKSKALLQERIHESFKIELAIICARTPTRRTGSQARS